MSLTIKANMNEDINNIMKSLD